VITAIDTNILVALWNQDDALSSEAERLLYGASLSGGLVIAGPVYVELRMLPDRTEAMIDRFLQKTGIDVDWRMDEVIWREAGKASHEYGRRRAAEKNSNLPRRIAGDFVIGAHAMVRGHALLTMDRRTFRIGFPRLVLADLSV
jgi:predicted nucleic acid-binding protein